MSIKRINEFPEGSGGLSSDDVFLFMDDPSGNGITKKISLNQLAAFLGNVTVVNSGLKSDPSGIPGASAITNIVQISQLDYNSLSTIDPNTLYISTSSPKYIIS